jgi:LPXTG-motif cell wall-anchored protein/uncharacterized repeat protein (TIGR01451 family)
MLAIGVSTFLLALVLAPLPASASETDDTGTVTPPAATVTPEPTDETQPPADDAGSGDEAATEPAAPDEVDPSQRYVRPGAQDKAGVGVRAAGDPPIFGTCSQLSTFDTGNAGWRFATTNVGGLSIRSQPRPVGWQATVGNPGGALIDNDPDAGWSELWTPALDASGYTTDYGFTIGSTVAFDYRNNTGIDYNIYMSVVGANGSIYWYNFRPQIVDSTQWTRVVVPIDPAQWRTSFNNNSGVNMASAPPTAAQFRAALENVDRFAFSVEGKNGPDTTIFDNFGLPCDDFGDAPASYGTTLAGGGPSHTLIGYNENVETADLMLGTAIDHEADGQPGAAATGDDTSGRDDEDGVSAPIQLGVGTGTTVTVSATNDTTSPATLAGWIDLDGDGQFEAAERVTVAVPASSGTDDYELTFPVGTTRANTYARFRLFSGTVAAPLPTGRVNAGEVEDYAVQSRYLSVSKSSDATTSTRVGDLVTYTVKATNNGAVDYTTSDPATVVDDLTGVVDDADLVAGSLAATVGGDPVAAPTRTGDRLTWSGPLSGGSTVTVTYQVRLNGDGDGRVRNVAFAPTGTPPAGVPDCEDGFDADLGVFCDSTSFALPRLAVEKTADRSSLPAVGEEVTFTVTATNTGDGSYTTDAPATVVDDLTDVLDDAQIDEDSIDASLPGEAELDGDRIGWSGALAPAQSVVIRYTVTYTGANDHHLVNVAFAPADSDDTTPQCESRDDGADPDSGVPCDRVQIPGSGLTVQKSVDPASGTNVAAGDELTYTLTFTNNGEADATVDHTDHVAGLADDATVSAPTSDDLDATPVTDGAFAVTGSVPAGETYTVSYTATVKDFADQGDHVLANFLTETGEDPPATCLPGSETCTVNYVPNLTVTKTSDPADGTAVQSGDEITYTLAFRNTGAGTASVDKVDDLGGVLDDAQLTDGPDTDALAAELQNGQIMITGPVTGGDTQRVSYTVTVNADGSHGDNLLANYVIDPDEQTPTECSGDACTTHPVGELAVSKTVDPASGTSVATGDRLTYTLGFENVGRAPVDVDQTDDLSGVLDDADVVTAPEATEGLLDLTGPDDGELTIDGRLAADERETVTYVVEVRPAGERGDDTLGNVVFDSDATPPTGPCTPVEDEAVTCTANPVEGPIEATKQVDPADGSAVRGGDTLTYTLTFRNVGQHAGRVDFVDRLGGVLDDATFVSGPTPSASSLDATRTDDVIHVTGSLDADEETTVTYQVTVKKGADRGDDRLANFLLATGVTFDPDAPCDSDDAACTSNRVAGDEADGLLPDTGALVSPWTIGGALALIGAGVALTRRRRETA